MANPTADSPREVSPREVAQKMKFEYSRGVKDHTTRNLETVSELLWKLEQQDLNIDAFIREAAELVWKQFGIESVAIGSMDHADKRYRYRCVVGLDKDVVDGFKKLSYTKDELFNPKTYPSYEISRRTRLFLSEDHPYADGEEFTYRRPALIGMRRRTVTDSLEADYLDFLFFGSNGETLGFIEVSGTRMKKLPDAVTIKWIELIASMVGMALQREWD